MTSFGNSRRAVSKAARPITKFAARARTSCSELTRITRKGRPSGSIGIMSLDVVRALEHNENNSQGVGVGRRGNWSKSVLHARRDLLTLRARLARASNAHHRVMSPSDQPGICGAAYPHQI